MIETAVGATMPDRDLGTVAGSVGRVMPNTHLRVVDPDAGPDLGAGEDGEVLVKGLQVMKGCLNRPEATAGILNAGGWLKTGDLGHVDAEGNAFVVDCLKELIKVSAHQVAPAEPEALVATRPSPTPPWSDAWTRSAARSRSRFPATGPAKRTATRSWSGLPSAWPPTSGYARCGLWRPSRRPRRASSCAGRSSRGSEGRPPGPGRRMTA